MEKRKRMANIEEGNDLARPDSMSKMKNINIKERIITTLSRMSSDPKIREMKTFHTNSFALPTVLMRMVIILEMKKVTTMSSLFSLIMK